jgi:hypothetical protein
VPDPQHQCRQRKIADRTPTGFPLFNALLAPIIFDDVIEYPLVLLGASPPTRSDPVAAKVLSRGESLTAPAGRADDFSWPRPGTDASAKPEVSPESIAVAPDTPEKLGTAARGDDKNQADAKKDANAKPKIDSRASARVGPHAYYNYYPGRYHGGYHR